MNNDKVEDPCFVCATEDELSQPRGSMRHPTNCAWRIKENDALRVATLEELYTIIGGTLTSSDKYQTSDRLVYAMRLIKRAIKGKA